MASNENRTSGLPEDVKNPEVPSCRSTRPAQSAEPERGTDVPSSASYANASMSGAYAPGIFKLLYTGLLAIVAPPVSILCGAMLYGCWKIQEAIGWRLAFAHTEIGWRSGRGSSGAQSASAGRWRMRPEVVEGQVAVEDVEAGQGVGPTSI